MELATGGTRTKGKVLKGVPTLLQETVFPAKSNPEHY